MSRLTAVALALNVSVAILSTSAFAQDKVLTVSWWGFNGDKLDEFVVKPFEAQCECTLQFETGNNGERLNRLQIRNGAGIDVIYLTDNFSQQGIELGLFQEIDSSRLPNLEGIYDLARDPQDGYGPAYTLGRVGLVYDSATLDTPITSWNDLWRGDLVSALSLPGIATTSGPMVVLKAGDYAGVDAYEDEDSAFEAIEALKANVVKNYNTSSEMINLFSTGEISVSVAQDFMVGQLKAAVPTAVWADLEEGAIATLNTVNIPVGAAEPDLAYEFIDFILSAEIQQKIAEEGLDAPVNTAVDLTPEQAEQWTYGADVISGLQRLDYSKLNVARTGWVERWNEVFGM